MKSNWFVLLLCAMAPFSGFATDVSDLAANPATIQAEGMQPVPLTINHEKKGWIEIPERFSENRATIFRPDKDQLGVTKFRVIESGYVLIACNYDYQGNASGNWQEEVLDERELRRLGWKEVRNSKLGGKLIQSDEREQIIFYKRVEKGETYQLRCNKYDPPYPILLRRTLVADIAKSGGVDR